MARVAMIGIALSAIALGCGGSGSQSTTTSAEEETAGGEDGVVVTIENDDSRVSRSAGEEGGVVVLWPRVMGLPGPEAQALQAHLVEVAQRVFPDRPLDVRPDPERVCPRGGCLGVSIGALLVTQNETCAVVAVVSAPGEGDLTLLRWAGRLTVRDRNVPFREPPESHITLQEATLCQDMAAELRENDPAIEEALRAAGN
jgi:hypothetical protein